MSAPGRGGFICRDKNVGEDKSRPTVMQKMGNFLMGRDLNYSRSVDDDRELAANIYRRKSESDDDRNAKDAGTDFEKTTPIISK